MLFRMLRLIGAYESVLVALHQVLYAIPDKAIPSGWKGVGQEVRGLGRDPSLSRANRAPLTWVMVHSWKTRPCGSFGL